MADTATIASRLVNDLQRDFGLTANQAFGLVGNLAMESQGFKNLEEDGAGTGFGYAQWTGSRRKQFELYAKENELDPTSYEANYGYLKKELRGKEKGTIAALRGAKDADHAARIVMSEFERPGIKNVSARNAWTDMVVNSYAPVTATAPVPQTLTPGIAQQRARVADAGGGLTSRSVNTVTVDGMGNPVAASGKTNRGGAATPGTPSSQNTPDMRVSKPRYNTIDLGVGLPVGPIGGTYRDAAPVRAPSAMIQAGAGTGTGAVSGRTAQQMIADSISGLRPSAAPMTATDWSSIPSVGSKTNPYPFGSLPLDKEAAARNAISPSNPDTQAWADRVAQYRATGVDPKKPQAIIPAGAGMDPYNGRTAAEQIAMSTAQKPTTVTTNVQKLNPAYTVYMNQLAKDQRMTPTGSVVTANQFAALNDPNYKPPAAAPVQKAPPQYITVPKTEVRYASPAALPQRDQSLGVASLLDTINRTGIGSNGYNYADGVKTGQADWAQGLTPAQQYAMANQRGGIAAAIAPRTGNAGGYSYVNGQKTGYAQPASVLGMTFETPTNGAQAYAMANALAKAEAQAKATRLGNARMATGSDVGSGIASSTNPWGI